MPAEARIRLGVDGVNDVLGALRRIKGEGVSLEGTLKGIASGMVRLGGDIAKAATGMRAIDFGAATEKYKALDDQITRMAVRGGKNIDDLKAKFRELGMQTGVGSARFADAVKQFDRMTFSGVDESAEAMKTLGIYAADTGRSIEEMAELGDVLWNKLGIPATRIQSELLKLKSIASDSGIKSGFLGLEQSATRNAGAYQRIEGTAATGSAIQAAAEKQGYSHEAATELTGKTLNAIAGLDPVLVRRALKTETKNKNYEPYRAGSDGRQRITMESIQLLQQHLHGAANPMGAMRGLFGTTLEGEEAGRFFYNAPLKEAAKYADDARGREAAKGNLAGYLRKGVDALGKVGIRIPDGSILSATEAGQREQRDLARDKYESEIGKSLQSVRDRREKALTAEQRAKIDTAVSYAPSWLQDTAAAGTALYYSDPNHDPLPEQFRSKPAQPGFRGAGFDPRGPAAAEADRLRQAAALEAIKNMPKAVVDGLQKADIKVRGAPLGAERDDARTPK